MIIARVMRRPALRIRYSSRQNSFEVSSIRRRPLHPPLHPVQLQIIHRQHRLRRQVAAAQQGPDTRREFSEGKRFAQVVVRAQVQTLHPVFHTGAPGQHQDRHTRFPRSQKAQNCHTVQPRQIEVENHQIEVQFSRHGPRLFPVRRNIHRVVFGFQTFPYETGKRRIVFRDKNSHKMALIPILSQEEAGNKKISSDQRCSVSQTEPSAKIGLR
jgi:hypothetical protein